MTVPSLISCVVPVNDGERFIAAAIDSILAQDHSPLEVVVVDNGSLDSSALLAERFGEPVRVLRQEDRGPPGGRNRGIREARGEFVAFLDADDLYRPAKLSTQLECLSAEPALDICLCTAESFWEPGLEHEAARYAALGKLRGTHTFGTMLARRAVFERVGLLDETRLLDDQAEWFLRAADAGLATRILPDVLVDRRMHAASMSHRHDVIDSYLELVAARLGRARRR